jgi:hypothetical protein
VRPGVVAPETTQTEAEPAIFEGLYPDETVATPTHCGPWQTIEFLVVALLGRGGRRACRPLDFASAGCLLTANPPKGC